MPLKVSRHLLDQGLLGLYDSNLEVLVLDLKFKKTDDTITREEFTVIRAT